MQCLEKLKTYVLDDVFSFPQCNILNSAFKLSPSCETWQEPKGAGYLVVLH